MKMNILLAQVFVVSLAYTRMHFSNAEPQVKLILGDSGNYSSGGNFNLTCTVDQNVSINRVIFERDQIPQVGIYDPTVLTCTPTKLLIDNYSYTAFCDGERNFTLTKYGMQAEDHGKVWQCTMISSAGGPCTNITPCVSQNISAFQRDTIIDSPSGSENNESPIGWIVSSAVVGFLVIASIVLGIIFRNHSCPVETPEFEMPDLPDTST